MVKPHTVRIFGKNEGMNMKLRKQIAERLRAAMAASGSLQTQSALERKSGVGQATIGRVLRGEADVRIETLFSLALALGKTISYFIGEDDRIHNVEAVHDNGGGRKAPIISWVQAGAWSNMADICLPESSEEWEEVPPSTGSNAFWLRVIGDSMTAHAGQSIPEGSLILVDPSVSADNGKLVVASLTDSSEVTFKKLIIDSGRKYLKPLNPSYPLMEINANCQIIGVVTEAKQRF